VHRHWLQLRRQHLGWFGRLSLLLNPYGHYVQYAEKAMFQHPDLRLVVCNSHW
jgi:UDP-glucose:(heptosyl)LPS alpha-1,3-glucosyltransferase